MNTYGDISGTTSSNNVIDEPLRSTPLPDAHPISGLEELREYSLSDNHRPFSAANKTAAGAEKGVVLAKNGKRPLNHTGPESHHYTNLVAHEWAKGKVCWTIDLNGKRHVVQTTHGSCGGGDRGGAIFRIWQGKKTKFDGPPIAFSISQAAQLVHREDLNRERRTSRILPKNKASDPVTDQHGDKSPESNRYPSRNHGDYANYRESSKYSDSETEIAPSKYRFNFPRRTSRGSTDEIKYNGKRPWTESEHLRLASNFDAAMGRIETDRNDLSQSRPSKIRLTIGSSSSHKAQTRRREEGIALSRKALSSGISIYESLPDHSAVADPTTIAKETTIPGRRNTPSAQNDSASSTTKVPLESGTFTSSGSEYSLPLFKLKNTILYISVVGRLGEENMNLQETSTLDGFFNAVLEVSDAVGQEDTLGLILITCPWLDGRKPMSIRRKYPSTFENFSKL